MKLKKRNFTVLIILICLFSCFFTCTPYDVEEPGRVEYTNVIYSPDGNTVTIYLDGLVPVPRSLNSGIAKMGCDYFEVTFLYNADYTTTPAVPEPPDDADDDYIPPAPFDPRPYYRVARGEWMAGKTASISGIYRTPGGVNYGNTFTPDKNQPATPGQGSAILFAGKTDKTLMAIGRLTAVDGTVGTTITTNTKSVTFTIAAISASAATAEISGSTVTGFTVTGFRTSAGSSNNFPTHADVSVANTIVERSNVSPNNVFPTQPAKCFPLFRLKPQKDIKATYTFDLYPLNSNSFNAYLKGILISSPGFGSVIPGLPPVPPDAVPTEIVRKQPRYTEPNGRYHESILMLDEKTVVMLENNNTPNEPFEPVVKFSFYTELTVSGSVFSLVFSIPVYALAEVDDYGKKSRWYIRSSYGPSLYDLDDGTQGMGGSILIATGTYFEPDSGNYAIRIETPPDKWRYNVLGQTSVVHSSLTGADVSSPEDRIFNINGLVVQLITTDDPPIVVKEIPYVELVFRIGVQDKYGRNPTWTAWTPQDRFPWMHPAPSWTPYVFPPDFYGCIEISVEYFHPGTLKTYYASFYLLVATGTHLFYTVPNSQIAHIYDLNYAGNPSRPNRHIPWDTFEGTPGTVTISGFSNAAEKFRHVMETNNLQERTIVIIVHNSFNIDLINVNTAANNSRMYFILAADEGNPPVIIGRGGTGSNLNSMIHNMKNPGLNAYYFGVWPFNENTIVPVNTKSFTVNTQGAYPNANTANSSTYSMIRNNDPNTPGSGMYNVKVNGATILPTVTIPPDTPDGQITYRYPLLY